MRKPFVTILPDEPYKTSTSKNITVDCVYTGPRYILVRIENKDGHVFCVDRKGDTLEEIEPFKLSDEALAYEDHRQVILDGEVHTWEAAHLTHEYTHESVPNYVETLPTGEVYEYYYDDEHGGLAQPFYTNDMYYKEETNEWIRPRMRTHAISRQAFFQASATSIPAMEEAVASGKYHGEQLAEITAFRDFLKNLDVTYAGVDHWKIPFPVHPNMNPNGPK